MTRLGHASANAALIYQHASAERDKSIVDGLTAMYRDAQSGSPSAAKNRRVKGRLKAYRGHEAKRSPAATLMA